MKFILKVYLLNFFILFNGLNASAQNININGCIKGIPFPKVYLGSVYAGKIKLIDSTPVSKDCFSFSESDTLRKGLYYIILNKEGTYYLQLVLNKEDVSFHTEYLHIVDSIKVTQSVENRIMYEYTKHALQCNRKITALIQKTTISKEDQEEAIMLKERNDWFVRYMIARYPHSLATAIIRSQEPIAFPSGLSAAQQEDYRYVHCFDNVDLDDEALTNTYVLSGIMNKYLAHHENASYSFNEQAEHYAIAVDSLLNKTIGHPDTHDFYLQELTNIFKYGNYDVIHAYIEAYYKGVKQKDVCESSGPALLTAKERLAAMKHASLGTKAPNITITGADNKVMKLWDMKSQHILIVFWSTDCYHCTQTLPLLKKVYDSVSKNGLTVIAVSVDTDEKSWKDFVAAGNYNWVNMCDLTGWRGQIPKDYNVLGTPTFVLLDKDKTIISKPVTIEDLVKKLKGIHLL